MGSIELSSSAVNSMSDQRAVNVAARLKRDVAIYRTAQVLADASACRAGEEPRGLSTMSADDRAWFHQTVRSIVDLYEDMVGIEAPTADDPAEVDNLDRSLSAQLLIWRAHGRDEATARGHRMGVYHPHQDGREGSACRRCGRCVVINLSESPSISGSAINEGCLTEAGKDEE